MFNVKKLAFGAAMLAASAVKVEIVTSEGNIVVNLNEKAAPTTVANFVKYAKEGFYNGTIFHRVINNFMIQGGGFDRNLHQKSTHAPIKLEDKNGLKNTVGYAVFGEVVTGMDVVRKIGRAPTGSKGFMDDVPVRPVIIESVKVLK
mgnify:CR=1 FL=1